MPVLCTIGAASVRSFGRSSVSAPPGQTAYTTPGTYSWVAPAGVTSVSVVAVGGGGASENPPTTGGGGGGLRYRNNISVTPGASYTVVVGNYAHRSATPPRYVGGTSSFNGTALEAFGGNNQAGGTGTAIGGSVGGGNGGNGGSYGDTWGGGGGAGGYSGNGGAGGFGSSTTDSGRTDGSGGGGAGGAGYAYATTAGGGVGILGQGSSGTGSGAGAQEAPRARQAGAATTAEAGPQMLLAGVPSVLFGLAPLGSFRRPARGICDGTIYPSARRRTLRASDSGRQLSASVSRRGHVEFARRLCCLRTCAAARHRRV